MQSPELPRIEDLIARPKQPPARSEMRDYGEAYLSDGLETFAVPRSIEGMEALDGYLGDLYGHYVKDKEDFIGNPIDTPRNQRRFRADVTAWIANATIPGTVDRIQPQRGAKPVQSLPELFRGRDVRTNLRPPYIEPLGDDYLTAHLPYFSLNSPEKSTYEELAARHGLEPRTRGAEVSLRFSRQPDSYYLRVPHDVFTTFCELTPDEICGALSTGLPIGVSYPSSGNQYNLSLVAPGQNTLDQSLKVDAYHTPDNDIIIPAEDDRMYTPPLEPREFVTEIREELRRIWLRQRTMDLPRDRREAARIERLLTNPSSVEYRESLEAFNQEEEQEITLSLAEHQVAITAMRAEYGRGNSVVAWDTRRNQRAELFFHSKLGIRLTGRIIKSYTKFNDELERFLDAGVALL